MDRSAPAYGGHLKRILIVKTSALGDVTGALALLPHLKALAPYAKVDWVCEKAVAPLLKAHPLISNVITIDSKKWRKAFFSSRKEIFAKKKEVQQKRYDIVFDLQGNCKSGIVTFFAWAKLKIGFGKKHVAEWPNLFSTHKHFNPTSKSALSDLLQIIYATFKKPIPKVSPTIDLSFEVDANEQAQIDALAINKKAPTLIVCPQSLWGNKRLKRRSLSQFLRMIEEHYSCHFLIAWGSSIEQVNAEKTAKEIGPAADLLPKLSAAGLHQAMSLSSGVISVDSFSLHLAGLTKKPIFAIFGPSLGSYYLPSGEPHTYFQGICPYNVTFTKRCPILRSCQSGSCMKQIEPSELFLTFKQSSLGKSLSKQFVETQSRGGHQSPSPL